MVPPQISVEAKKVEIRMDTKNIYEGVEHVVNISTDVSVAISMESRKYTR